MASTNSPSVAFTGTFHLGDLGIRLRTTDAGVASSIEERYGTFLSGETPGHEIDIERRDDVVPSLSSPGMYRMEVEIRQQRMRLTSPVITGEFDFERRRGHLSVYSHPRFGAGVYLENALRQIGQVLAIRNGGFLLHAAAAAPSFAHPAHLFPGPSGRGKTTLSKLLRDAGGVVYSDDLVLLETRGARPYLGTTPFYGSVRELAPVAARRTTVAAIHLLERAGSRRVGRTVIPSVSTSAASLVANVPFIECVGALERLELMDSVLRLVQSTSVGQLRFRKDSSFLPSIHWPRASEPCPRIPREDHASER